MNDTKPVEALTVHALFVVLECTEYVTGLPEAPPMASMSWLSPIDGDAGGVGPEAVPPGGVWSGVGPERVRGALVGRRGPKELRGGRVGGGVPGLPGKRLDRCRPVHPRRDLCDRCRAGR